MKFRSIIAALLILGMSFNALSPRRAEAGLGLILVNFGDLLTGPLLLVAAAGTGGGAISLGISAYHSSGWKAAGRAILTVLAGTGAVILLDQDSPKYGEFLSLNAEQARELGLSKPEWNSYESERDLVNALREEVMVQVQSAMKENPQMDADEALRTTRALWQDQAHSSLSSQTIRAVEKIASKTLGS